MGEISEPEPVAEGRRRTNGTRCTRTKEGGAEALPSERGDLVQASLRLPARPDRHGEGDEGHDRVRDPADHGLPPSRLLLGLPSGASCHQQRGQGGSVDEQVLPVDLAHPVSSLSGVPGQDARRPRCRASAGWSTDPVRQPWPHRLPLPRSKVPDTAEAPDQPGALTFTSLGVLLGCWGSGAGLPAHPNRHGEGGGGHDRVHDPADRGLPASRPSTCWASIARQLPSAAWPRRRLG